MREIPNFPNVSLILISSKYFWSPKGFNLWLIHRQKSDAQRTTMNMFLWSSDIKKLAEMGHIWIF
jgi:hypothetical protein